MESTVSLAKTRTSWHGLLIHNMKFELNIKSKKIYNRNSNQTEWMYREIHSWWHYNVHKQATPICKQMKAPNDQKHWKWERKNTTYIRVNRPLAQLFNFKMAKYQKLPIDYRSNKPISKVTLSAKYQ